jgi:peptidoglycan/xylan/chitin deacetylase (PgdA/CDA1 family)
LARREATATFFLVGEQVAKRPALAREIVDAGHEVAVHGYRHTLLLRRRVHELAEDLDRAVVAIADATGVAPTLYRPPYGVFSSGALAHIRRRGWRPLLWSTWGRDWERRATAQSIARRATKGLRAGDVVLLHDSDAYSSDDSWRRTAAALPLVLEAVAALGIAASAVAHST